MAFDIKFENQELKIHDKTERKIIRFHCKDWKFMKSKHFKYFKYPVDIVFSGLCKEIKYDTFLTFVRNYDTYDIITQIERNKLFQLPKNKYIIEIDSHVKIYAFVDSEIRIACDKDANITFEFDKKTEIIFGVRSYHKRPESTIRVTEDIGDIAKAISLLSSSIKVKNCERSYPTLRGHPPLIEISDHFVAPDNLKKISSDVEIYVPEKLEYLYTVAPLAYYLLADIRFGEPKIVSNGFEYHLSKFPNFEDEVNWLLRKIFFLDCLVRNAGVYKLNLKELEAIEDLDIDIDDLFQLSIGEQLPTYIDIPDEKIKDSMPTWHLSSYVKPSLKNLESIPFLLNDLSTIYLPRYKPISEREIMKMSLNDFFRGNVLELAEVKNIGNPFLKDSQNHIWISDETIINCARSNEKAFYNQLKYLDKDKDHIDIALVLNDEKMIEEEELVREIYRRRTDISLKTKIFEYLSRDEFSDIFARDFDLIHYVGHCENGLLCYDGPLKTKEIEKNNTPAFFLNACNSYEEGEDLIKKGSVSGIVTLYKVCNEEALKVGYNFSRLLSKGFSIGKAMEIARLTSLYGRDYLVIGNPEYCLMQNIRTNITPSYEIEKINETDILLKVKGFGSGMGMGGFFYLHLENSEQHHLLYNEAILKMTIDELDPTLSNIRSWAPIIFKNRLYWTDEIPKLKADLDKS